MLLRFQHYIYQRIMKNVSFHKKENNNNNNKATIFKMNNNTKCVLSTKSAY